MSEPTLWRRCPEAREHGTASSDYGPQWYCVCHGANGESLVPVAAGAVLIEDGEQAAVTRAAAVLDELLGVSDFDTLAMATAALRAACGEGDR